MKNPGASDSPSVIIPVYNAYEETRLCLESVLANTRPPYRLLLIDDGSPDRRIWPLLLSVSEGREHVQAYRNKRNRGYSAVVNRGCALAGAADVVLLNSDTSVTEGWLDKLSRCARLHDAVATVTPLSNAAGVFSVPVRNRVNKLPGRLGIAGFGRLVEQLSPGLRPEVPVGNGFCMYVTRKALKRVGGFDTARFPAGYGAENDFCMRAGRLGFVHLVEDATFIYHKRSASFRLGKYAALYRGEKQLNRLHPQYRRIVRQWLAADPLEEFRRRLQQFLAKGTASRGAESSGGGNNENHF